MGCRPAMCCAGKANVWAAVRSPTSPAWLHSMHARSVHLSPVACAADGTGDASARRRKRCPAPKYRARTVSRRRAMRHRLHVTAATAAAALAVLAALAAATAAALRQIRRHRCPQRKISCLRAALLRSLETIAADSRWSQGRGVVVLSGGLDR
eukprot:350964-Chlamydomonas_euryale.AAC.4